MKWPPSGWILVGWKPCICGKTIRRWDDLRSYDFYFQHGESPEALLPCSFIAWIESGEGAPWVNRMIAEWTDRIHIAHYQKPLENWTPKEKEE